MSNRFDEVVAIMARLRGDGGCPWDRKQTRESLKSYLIEEAYEVLETIDAQDDRKLKEELGLAEKLIRRHPHVFSESPSDTITAAEVLHRWEEIKQQEKAQQSEDREEGSAIDGVPKALPALLRAYQLQLKAARVGFDWPEGETGYRQILEKIQEELQEVGAARAEFLQMPHDRSLRRLEDEIGDLLFAVVNLARHLKLNPEEALRRTANRFTERFTSMEAAAMQQGHRLSDMSLKEQEVLWEQAKAAERKGTGP